MSSIVQYNDWLEEEVLYSKELLVIYTQEEKVLFCKKGLFMFQSSWVTVICEPLSWQTSGLPHLFLTKNTAISNVS